MFTLCVFVKIVCRFLIYVKLILIRKNASNACVKNDRVIWFFWIRFTDVVSKNSVKNWKLNWKMRIQNSSNCFAKSIIWKKATCHDEKKIEKYSTIETKKFSFLILFQIWIFLLTFFSNRSFFVTIEKINVCRFLLWSKVSQKLLIIF